MQSVLWFLIEVAANAFESFLCFNFIIKSFGGKCKKFNPRIILIIGMLIDTVIVTVLNRVTIYEGFLGLLYAVWFFVFSLVFLHGSVAKKFFISVLTDICLISTAAITSNVLFAVFEDDNMKIYKEHTLERIIFMVIGIALLAYVFAVLVRFTCGQNDVLKTKEWTLILSVFAVSFLIFAAIQIVIINRIISESNLILLMLSELGLILINIICLYITANLSETHKREENLLVEIKQNEYTQKYARAVKEQYEQTRRLRHDMKQYCTVLDGLIADKKYDEARELISENYKSISRSEVVVDLGNDFVNSILNAKLTLAKSLGIEVICSVEKELLGIESADLCNLLGNMLDNAIEAAQKCEPEKRSIELNISSVGNRLNITIRNSIGHSVLNENPNLTTSKPDQSEHGFGIKTIKSIAEKYGGTTDFYEENLTFICRVELQKSAKDE